jgi:hypothetical protein
VHGHFAVDTAVFAFTGAHDDLAATGGDWYVGEVELLDFLNPQPGVEQQQRDGGVADRAALLRCA